MTQVVCVILCHWTSYFKYSKAFNKDVVKYVTNKGVKFKFKKISFIKEKRYETCKSTMSFTNSSKNDKTFKIKPIYLNIS